MNSPELSGPNEPIMAGAQHAPVPMVTSLNNDQISYLTLIQSTVNRMATSSAVLKGFAATAFSTLAAMTYSNASIPMMLSLLLPLCGFILLDTYYLSLERKYRDLYDLVRTQKIAPNYSLKINDGGMPSRTWVSTLRSLSIVLFYLPLIAAAALLILLKKAGN